MRILVALVESILFVSSAIIILILLVLLLWIVLLLLGKIVAMIIPKVFLLLTGFNSSLLGWIVVLWVATLGAC